MICSWCPCLQGPDRPPHKQDGPWSWVVLFTTFMQNWLCAGFARSYGVFLPVFMREFNEGREKIALIGSFAGGGTFLLAVLTSWLCSHFGEQLIFGMGCLVVTVSLILSSLIYAANAMFSTYSVLLPIGFSFLITPNILLIVKYFKKRRSLALGINSAGVGVGVMTVPIIIQYLIDVLGWRNTFRVFSGCFALIGFTALVFDPNVEEESHGDSGETADSSDSHRRSARKVLTLRSMFDLSVWKVPKYTIAVISISLASFAVFNPVIHLVKFSEEIGVSAVKASTLFTFLGLTSIISRIVSGRLSDFSHIDPGLVNMSAEVLGGVSLFLLPFAKSYAHLVVFACVQGLVDGTFRSTCTILLTTTVIPPKASSAFGQGYSITALFSIVGPSIAGLMADTSGTYKTAFFMSGGVLLGAATVHILPACLALRNKARESSLELDAVETTSSPCTGMAYRERKGSSKEKELSQNSIMGCPLFSTGGAPRKQDGPWAWLVLTCVFWTIWLSGGICYSFGVYLPIFMKEFNETREKAALVGSLNFALFLCLIVISSQLCDRYGCRVICAIGHAISALGFVLSSLSHSIIPMYFSHSLLTGFGSSCIQGSGFLIIGLYFRKRRSLAVGIVASAVAIGAICWGPLAQYLLTIMEWRNIFRLIAGIYVLMSFLTIFYDTNVENPANSTKQENCEGEACRRKNFLKSVFDTSIWKVPLYTVSVLSNMVACFGHPTVQIHVIKFANEIGIGALPAAALFVFFGSTSVITRVIAGQLCDTRFIRANYVNQAAEIISGISTILLTQATTYAHLVVFSVFYGMADGAFRTTLNVLFLDSVGSERMASAFYVAGTITVAGSFMYFLLLCWKCNDQRSTSVATEVRAGSIKDELENTNTNDPECDEEVNTPSSVVQRNGMCPASTDETFHQNSYNNDAFDVQDTPL